VSVGFAVLATGVVVAVTGCGGSSSTTTGTTAATTTTATESDLHKRAQSVVNLALLCLAEIQVAGSHTDDINAMASTLDTAKSDCDNAASAIAVANDKGFSGQSSLFFGAADAGKQAAAAGLDYLDTSAPSKLAEFNRHIDEAGSLFDQGFNELNAELKKQGEPPVVRGTSSATSTTTAGASPPTTPPKPKSAFTSCDGRVEALAGSTSCAFAQNVFYEFYEASPEREFPVYSPATGMSYQMHCTGESMVTCAGGNGAEVRFPMSAVEAYTESAARAYANSHDLGR
jgi:hypothetical protein